MDAILQAILSWQILLFGLAIFAFVFVIRKIVEFVLSTTHPPVIETKFWKEVMLPIAPIVTGCIAGMLISAQSIYPNGIHEFPARAMFGLVAGLLCGFFFRMINAFFGAKIGALASAIFPNSTVTAPQNQITELSDDDLVALEQGKEETK